MAGKGRALTLDHNADGIACHSLVAGKEAADRLSVADADGTPPKS